MRGLPTDNLRTLLIPVLMVPVLAAGTWLAGVPGFVCTALGLVPVAMLTARQMRLEKEARLHVEQLKEGERFHRTLMDRLSVGVLIIDAQQGAIEDCNPAALRLAGVDSASILGHPFTELLSPVKPLGTPLEDLRHLTPNEEWELVRKDGGKIPLLKSAQLLDLHGREKVLVTLVDISERRRSEAVRAEMSELRRALLDRSAVGVFLTSKERFIVEASQQACSMFGYTHGELIGRNFRLLHVSQQAYEEALNLSKKLVSQGGASMEYRYRKKDGTVIWCSVAGTLLDPEDPAKGTVWTLVDVSERKRIEQEMRESEERYSAIVNNSPGIVMIHIGGRIVFINEAGMLASGYPLSEIQGANIMTFIAPESREKVVSMMRRREAGDVVPDYEIEFFIKGGERRNLIVKSANIRYNGLPASLVVLVDISERKKTEARLAYREAFEKELTLVSAEFVNVSLQELHGLFQRSLERMALFLDVDRASIHRMEAGAQGLRLAQRWKRSLVPDEPDQAARIIHDNCPQWWSEVEAGRDFVVQDPATLEEAWHGERQHLEARGVRSLIVLPLMYSRHLLGCVSFETILRPRVWMEDEIHLLRVLATLFASAINRENSDLALQDSKRNLELAVAQANELAKQAEQANQSKSQFLANMSHELRTPLNVILGMSELLREKILGPLTADQADSIRSVEESGRHLLALINDILDLAKIEAGKMHMEFSHVRIEDAVSASIRMVEDAANRKSIRISRRLSDAPAQLFADSRRLRQILINLLSNAVKFTQEGGEVGVDVDRAEGGVRFVVWDNGIGIPPEKLQHLFQPFVQVDSSMVKRHGGTGLGLALVRHFTTMQGGRVSVESIPGKGSRFLVLLPERGGAAQVSQVEAPMSVPDPGSVRLPPGLRILMVDDHKENLRLLSQFLAPHKPELHLACNGVEGVAKATELLPDLILMDVQMPEMDGLQATRILKAAPTTSRIPIICLTAYAMSSDRDKCLEAGVDAYLSKPIDFKLLLETLIRFSNPKAR